jgi:hypothetical protein
MKLILGFIVFSLSTSASAEKIPTPPAGIKSNYLYLENYPKENLILQFNPDSKNCKDNFEVRSFVHMDKVTGGEVEVWHVYASCVSGKSSQKTATINNLKRMAHIHVTHDEGLKLTTARK